MYVVWWMKIYIIVLKMINFLKIVLWKVYKWVIYNYRGIGLLVFKLLYCGFYYIGGNIDKDSICNWLCELK